VTDIDTDYQIGAKVERFIAPLRGRKVAEDAGMRIRHGYPRHKLIAESHRLTVVSTCAIPMNRDTPYRVLVGVGGRVGLDCCVEGAVRRVVEIDAFRLWRTLGMTGGCVIGGES